MDNADREGRKPVPQQAPDWYGFHQGAPARGSERSEQPGPQRPAEDPYGYHQGPGRRQPGDGQPNPQKPGKDKGGHKLTLYEVAETNLRAHGTKITNQDQIYFHLNDLMVRQGHQKANIDGRTKINDHMLPNSWNYVSPRKFQEAVQKAEPPKPEPPKPEPKPEPPKPGDDKAGSDNGQPKSPEEQARAEYQKKLEAEIAEKYSLPPIEKGKGYYDAVAKAHPDWKASQVLDEARRVRKLNDNRVDLKVGERISTISKEDRAAMIAKAMEEYDKAQQPGA